MAAPEAPPALTLLDLPDDLLLRCLQPVCDARCRRRPRLVWRCSALLAAANRRRCPRSSTARPCPTAPPCSFHSYIPLVCKRFAALCEEPQLLQIIRFRFGSGVDDAPRLAALSRFLAACAAHVRQLHIIQQPAVPDDEDRLTWFDIRGAEPAPEALALALAPCMAALPAMTALRRLELRCSQFALRLPSMSHLTGLTQAQLVGSQLRLEGALPRSLVHLHLGLHVALPTSLSELTQLRSLHAMDPDFYLPSPIRLDSDDDSSDEEDGWFPPTFVRCVPHLTALTSLVTRESAEPRGHNRLPIIGALPTLERLRLRQDGPDIDRPPLDTLRGPALLSLRWLAVRWKALERGVPALRAAPRLEFVASLTGPERAEDDDGHWDAAWDFLATHPPLRAFGHYWGRRSKRSHDPNLFCAWEQLHLSRPDLSICVLPRTFTHDGFMTASAFSDFTERHSISARLRCGDRFANLV